MLMALSSNEVDLESLLPDVGIAAHPEYFLTDRRVEAEAAAIARRPGRDGVALVCGGDLGALFHSRGRHAGVTASG